MNQRFEVNGLDSHCSTLFLLFCFQNKIISSGQTHVLSAFTAVLQFIADTNFSTTTLELQSGSTTPSAKSSSSSTTHRTALNLLLSLSNSATFNVTWRISSSQLESLKAAAKSSLAQIQSAEDSAFTHVFMTKRNFFLNYNLYLHIQLTPSSPFFLTRYTAYKLPLWALFFVFFPSFVSLFLSFKSFLKPFLTYIAERSTITVRRPLQLSSSTTMKSHSMHAMSRFPLISHKRRKNFFLSLWGTGFWMEAFSRWSATLLIRKLEGICFIISYRFSQKIT